VVQWTNRAEETAERRRKREAEEEEEFWCSRIQALVSQPEFIPERPLPAEILPCLRISSEDEVRDPARLAASGVTHVFSCILSPTNPTPPVHPIEPHHRMKPAHSVAWKIGACGVIYGGVGAEDKDGYPMLDLHYDEFKGFMNEALATSSGTAPDPTDAPETTAAPTAAMTTIESMSGKESQSAELQSPLPYDASHSTAVSQSTQSTESAHSTPPVVLVHCQAGVNRSGVLAVAYVMDSQRWPLMRALRHCLEARGPLLWNLTFQRQLLRFARSRGLLLDDSSSHPPHSPPPGASTTLPMSAPEGDGQTHEEVLEPSPSTRLQLQAWLQNEVTDEGPQEESGGGGGTMGEVTGIEHGDNGRAGELDLLDV